jgi:hypothetical protein
VTISVGTFIFGRIKRRSIAIMLTDSAIAAAAGVYSAAAVSRAR